MAFLLKLNLLLIFVALCNQGLAASNSDETENQTCGKSLSSENNLPEERRAPTRITTAGYLKSATKTIVNEHTDSQSKNSSLLAIYFNNLPYISNWDEAKPVAEAIDNTPIKISEDATFKEALTFQENQESFRVIDELPVDVMVRAYLIRGLGRLEVSEVLKSTAHLSRAPEKNLWLLRFVEAKDPDELTQEYVDLISWSLYSDPEEFLLQELSKEDVLNNIEAYWESVLKEREEKKLEAKEAEGNGTNGRGGVSNEAPTAVVEVPATNSTTPSP